MFVDDFNKFVKLKVFTYFSSMEIIWLNNNQAFLYDVTYNRVRVNKLVFWNGLTAGVSSASTNFTNDILIKWRRKGIFLKFKFSLKWGKIIP